VTPSVVGGRSGAVTPSVVGGRSGAVLPRRFDGRVALVTGAARGQGRSHAVRLAAEGADVIAVDGCGAIDTVPYPLGSRADLQETVTAVTELGRRAVAVVADVRDLDALTDAVDRAVAEMGRLDVVCANAGITSAAPVTTLDETTWRDVVDVDLTGVWHTCRAVVGHLQRSDGDRAIVVTGSAAALTGYAGIGHYVAAKHGVVGLVRCLAQELAPRRIRVNGVHPTQVDTPMIMNDALIRLFCPDIAAPTRDDLAVASQRMHWLPAPWVEPGDVSAAVAFLASAEARAITGIALPVDCGVLLR
jgi:(+)-trans-carveol dehydrogenase